MSGRSGRGPVFYSTACPAECDGFFVKIKTSVMPANQTAKEYWQTKTNKEIDSTLSAADFKAKVTSSGALIVDGKEFYYIFYTKKFTNGTKTYHRSYYLYLQNRLYTITTTSVDPETDKTKSDIESMINSFKFE